MSRQLRRFARGEEVGLEVEAGELDSDLIDIATLGGGDPRNAELTGTKALMLAVLEDGIRSYLGNAKSVAQEADHWIHSGQRRSPFSFVVVCETLNLDPEAVRRVLQRLRSEQVSPKKVFPRARPNVRMAGRIYVRRKRR
jgi:hypothetical protein